jgi:RNA polymerase sigma-70 factor (ECF subfamily)
MLDQPSSVTLLLLAQAGDRGALNQLLSDLQDGLYGYLVRLVGDKHLAEDILQEVFVLIWRKLFWLRDSAVFRPWAYRIASREAFRRLRKHRFQVKMLGHETSLAELPAREVPPLPHGWAEALPGLLACLSPASRAVLILHYLQGMTLNEVADVLEVSPGTVKSRLAYGLAALREKIGPDGSLPPAAQPRHDPPANRRGAFRDRTD